jgi:hypothetical protein
MEQINPAFMRIFIGTSSNGEDYKAERALEYSLRKNCLDDIEIVWMRQNSSPLFSGWKTDKWATPFTNFRWAVPEACGYKGKAIYMDVDQLNIRNISDLYNIKMTHPIHARFVINLKRHETSVMLMDCDKLKEILPSIEELKQMMHLFTLKSNFIGDLNARWNCLDGEGLSLEKIWHLHFTNMDSQPWHPSWNKREHKNHIRPDLVKYLNKIYEESIM